MKKLLLAAGAILATEAPVLAGDLPYQRNYQPAPAAASLFNWTGFYVGANAGYTWGSAIGGDPSGVIGGFTAGYNYQYSPNTVLGLETDIAFSNADTSRGGLKFADRKSTRLNSSH